MLKVTDVIKLINEQINELENLNRIKDIVAPQSIKRVVDKQMELLKKLKWHFREGYYKK